jgi:hypothetical protein
MTSVFLSGEQEYIRESIDRATRELHAAAAAADPRSAYQCGVAKWVASWGDEFARSLLLNENTTAEHAFRVAMHELGKAEARRFILTNMMEALKQGDDLSTVVDRFNGKGVFNIVIKKTSTDLTEGENA